MCIFVAQSSTSTISILGLRLLFLQLPEELPRWLHLLPCRPCFRRQRRPLLTLHLTLLWVSVMMLTRRKIVRLAPECSYVQDRVLPVKLNDPQMPCIPQVENQLPWPRRLPVCKSHRP